MEGDPDARLLGERLRQTLERRHETEVVEHSGAKLDREAAHVLERGNNVLPQLGEGRAGRVVGQRLLERLEPEQDRGQRLPGLVVELVCEPLPLQLLRRHDAAQRIARHSLRQLDGHGGAGGERLGQPQVVVGEPGVGAFLVVDLDHADHPLARDERHPHSRPHGEAPRHLLVYLGIVDHRVDALAAPAREDTAALRARAGDRLAQQVLRRFARHSGEPQLLAAARQGDGDDPCPHQLAQAADDEVEQPLEIGLGRECVPDLFQRLQLARPAGRGLVEARILDCYRRLAGKQGDELLVLLGKVLSPLLLGEVEVAVGDAAQQDRDAEEALHRRMPRWEPDRPRILGEVVQPQRRRVADQHPENPAAARHRADLGAGVGVDAVREELLQLRAARVDHAERRVARARQLGRRLHEPVQQGLERQLGADGEPGLEQRAQPSFADGQRVHGASLTLGEAGTEKPQPRSATPPMSPARGHTRLGGKGGAR